jgi:hypothetical protein
MKEKTADRCTQLSSVEPTTIKRLTRMVDKAAKIVLSTIRKPGRPKNPTTKPKIGKVIQRRGRKARAKIDPILSNVQLAELADVWKGIFGGSNLRAARIVIRETGCQTNERNAKLIAKQISELSAINREKRIRNKQEPELVDQKVGNFSLAAQLHRANKNQR